MFYALRLSRLCSGILVILLSPMVFSDDWGSSHNLLIKSNLNQSWFWLSRSNLALRQDNEQVFLGYTGASMGYQINKRLSTRIGYRIARFRIGENFRTEQRPMAELYYGITENGWRVTSRSRIEWRVPDWREDDRRYRQEFTATMP